MILKDLLPSALYIRLSVTVIIPSGINYRLIGLFCFDFTKLYVFRNKISANVIIFMSQLCLAFAQGILIY